MGAKREPLPQFWWREDAVALSRRLASGEVTPTELLDATFERCQRLNPGLNAFVHLDRAQAGSAALEADERQQAGARIGALDGIPIAIKDNIFVAGMPASWGSRLFADHVPDHDDIVVERLRRSGAIIIGKTSTPELSLFGRTQSPQHGITRNPWDLRLTPGGSSGGSVVAVAAGMVPLALGTDAGGSTRLPASYTGVIGLKPSTGRIPRREGFPPTALDFQAVGLVARSVTDLDILYRAVVGPDRRDPASNAVPEWSTVDGGQRLRLGLFTRVDDEAVDPVVEASTREAADLLSEHGCEVIPCTAPYDLSAIRDVWTTLTAAGAARVVARFSSTRRRELSSQIAALAERGEALTAVDYVNALDRLSATRSDIGRSWGDFDAYLTPTAASPAWPAEDEFPATVAGVPGHGQLQSVFATWANLAGFPAISVPVRPHPDGRPIGVQIVAASGREEVVLEIARRLESARPWDSSWPPLVSGSADHPGNH